MAQRASERLVNLTICLLVARQYVPKHRIREVVLGYRGLSDVAFERMFARDKVTLENMGVPISVGSNNPLFADEVGYRIPRKDFELPPIEFTSDEAAIVGSAARVWQLTHVAGTTALALAKLNAAGVDAAPDRLGAVDASVTATEPAFDAIWQATVERQRVSFHYRGSADVRTIEPWRVAWRNGSWYVVGRDVDRDAPRVFKLSRITSEATMDGRQGAYTVPPGVDLDELTRTIEPAAPSRDVVVAIRDGRAPALRRSGARVDDPRTPGGFTAWAVPSRDDVASELASFGPHVLVLEPPELAEAVKAHLRTVVDAHTSPGGGS
ncbi:MAG TPA: WYL domain-containing protein [Propionibacteriaceae bacterium]|nr:WYL domain-containing protein [Propionibacteriaceae bacterium]